MSMIGESTTMVYFMLFIGSAFGAFLFSLTEQRCIALIFGAAAALFFSLFVYGEIRNKEYLKENGYTEYMLRLYYLGGSQSVKKFVTYPDEYPYIHSYRGCYTLEGVFDPEQGVVRFEVLGKRNIPYEKFMEP